MRHLDHKASSFDGSPSSPQEFTVRETLQEVGRVIHEQVGFIDAVKATREDLKNTIAVAGALHSFIENRTMGATMTSPDGLGTTAVPDEGSLMFQDLLGKLEHEQACLQKLESFLYQLERMEARPVAARTHSLNEITGRMEHCRRVIDLCAEKFGGKPVDWSAVAGE